MRVIYEDAERVIVWIGRETEPEDIEVEERFKKSAFWGSEDGNEPTTDIPFTLTVIGRLADAYEKHFDRDVPRKPFEEIQKDFSEMVILRNLEVRLPAIVQKVWLGVACLFWRSWFTRVWVFQEYLVGLKTSIVCGRFSLDGRAMEHFLKLIMFKFGSLQSLPLILQLTGVERGIRIMLKTNFSFLGMKVEDELFAWLLHTSYLSATDPRDKVYAVMGPRVAKKLNPSYDISPAEVYQRAARFILERSSSLDVLFTVNGSKMNGLASWAPDWTITSQSLQSYPGYLESIHSSMNLQILTQRSRAERAELLGYLVEPESSWGYKVLSSVRFELLAQQSRHPYSLPAFKLFRRFREPEDFLSATKQSRSKAKFSKDGKSLILSGFTVCTIDDIGGCQHPFPSSMLSFTSFTAEQEQIFDEWDSMFFSTTLSTGPHPYPTEDDRKKAFGMLMFGTDLKLSQSAANSESQKFLEQETFKMYRLSRRTGFELEEAENTSLRELKITTVESVVSATAGCSFFSTSTGHIGLLVPHHGAQKGNLVVLLRGAPLPLIVRKRGDYFQLVGRCYVQGFMRGEQWDSRIRAGAKLEKFVLV
jgi:hypothetical protein